MRRHLHTQALSRWLKFIAETFRYCSLMAFRILDHDYSGVKQRQSHTLLRVPPWLQFHLFNSTVFRMPSLCDPCLATKPRIGYILSLCVGIF
jgi:hypothetical protein